MALPEHSLGSGLVKRGASPVPYAEMVIGALWEPSPSIVTQPEYEVPRLKRIRSPGSKVEADTLWSVRQGLDTSVPLLVSFPFSSSTK